MQQKRQMVHVAMTTKETRIAVARAGPLLAYWTPEAVAAMAEAARHRRNGERNANFIRVVYVGNLRASKALALTPGDVGPGAILRLRVTKGKKPRPVAITQAVADALLAHAQRQRLAEDDRLFPFSRFAARRIVQQAARDAGTWCRAPGPTYCATQGRSSACVNTGTRELYSSTLGHARPDTTLRYLTTLQVEEAVRINQRVDPEAG